jgi:hypothetical protein
LAGDYFSGYNRSIFFVKVDEMPVHSIYLSKLNQAQRSELVTRLWEGQSHRCFLCDEKIDLDLHEIHIDHIVPIVHQGPDDPINFAVMHASCNETKSATNLEIARLLSRFAKLQETARVTNGRGATLHEVLANVGGQTRPIKIKSVDGEVQYTFADLGDNKVQRANLHYDARSKMQYFFGLFPVEYLHHDDRINPRTIGGSLKGLLEEFYAGRPQLHVSLAWWSAGTDGLGPLKVFDGQHKAAAQILLGAKRLPVRVFLDPDINVLLQANTNAGDKLTASALAIFRDVAEGREPVSARSPVLHKLLMSSLRHSRRTGRL